MITKQRPKMITPISAYMMEPKTTAGFIHSIPMVISFKNSERYLCPPPLEKPPYEPPELRELLEEQFSVFGSQLEHRLMINSIRRITKMTRMMVPQPTFLPALAGPASLRLSRSFLSLSL